MRLQEKNLEILVRNRGFAFTDTFFPYTSGQIGLYYVYSEAVMQNGSDYAKAIQSVAYLVNKQMNEDENFIISGGETRDWIFSNPVAFFLQKAHASLYKDGKIIGTDMKDRKVVHVADLNNEGSSLRDHWLPAIRNNAGILEGLIFYVERMEDGIKVVRSEGLASKTNAVVVLDANAWDYLIRNNVITQEMYRNLMIRLEDKKSWALDMLKSRKGFEELINLFKNPKTKEKARKIVNIGYPEIKEELSARCLQEEGFDFD